MTREIATFGAGCFWQVEYAFSSVKGVLKTSVGYMGGHFPHPSYLDVLARITGHAEVAQIEFDPQLVSYGELLKIFWKIHDPTQLNRQGPDRGEQYRSVIFYHSLQQQQEAQISLAQLSKAQIYTQEIVTQIEPAGPYYQAAEEHQQYLTKRKYSHETFS